MLSSPATVQLSASGRLALTPRLFGRVSPSGKLPVTFPRVTGQIPMYYAQKRTGKPPTPESIVRMDDIPARAEQLSIGNTSFHLDVHPSPLFPFGYGLSYTTFRYEHLHLSSHEMRRGEPLTITVDLSNAGAHEATEVVQLYVRDPVASVTRPVRELKAFQRITLVPGERRQVSFTLDSSDLAFVGRSMQSVVEAGQFHLWVGGSSEADLYQEFTLVD